ncbi:DUF6934 family protein [Filimonas effusa]|uniref:Uncharacterized protein n=1 Tax=Filimonas effusa TaxID=2508721 RepID=A0A4Q1D4R3_9BACT|nr:hypothetical protein [Filimonas effusa]RXK83472.1 hypothetical protein ESB13_15370 [Filimonas effusa]
MRYEIYRNLRITEDFRVVDFTSEGKKGNISKRIVFSATEWKDVYNLAFGDIGANGEIDDFSISDNGDRNKILATVVDVVMAYTKRYPDRLIFFRGSTRERTRLYRMAVGINLRELSCDFDIYAFVGEDIMPFTPNMEMTAFLIKRKKV